MYSSTTTKLPNGKIPIIHKEIQPVVHHEIQPVVTTEVQPVIHKYIQPVIFPEKLSIEEVIQQLQQLKKSHNCAIIRFGEPTNGKDDYQHFIQKIEQHTIKREVVPQTKRETKHIKQYEFVPYIQYSNGNIVPFANNSINSINNNSQMNDTTIAIIFKSIGSDYPIACKKTDIFANVEYKLYQRFPGLKSKNVYFLVKGNIVNRANTLEQNHIEDGDIILMEENILNNS